LKDVEFDIHVKMNERWIDNFVSMLDYMQSCGERGHSGIVAFYADGDGDFRPKFKLNGVVYNQVAGYTDNGNGYTFPRPEVLFDAG